MDNQHTNPSYYREASAEESLNAAEDVINHIHTIDPPTGGAQTLVRPVLTPRFAISCTEACLEGLGALAQKYPDVLVQTHFCEAQQEVAATLAQYPDFKSEADLYAHYGLLNERSVLAHCTTVTDYEIEKLRERNCGVAHCPVSNTTVGGGFMAAPVRRFLDMGVVKVGLGTDSGGGFSGSLMEGMRMAVVVGNAREVMGEGGGKEGRERERRLGLEEVFYMATLGGARVLGLDNGEGGVGRLEVGRGFDAVGVRIGMDEDGEDGEDGEDRKDEEDDGVMTAVEEREGWKTTFEKWVMTGDDRNVSRVWVRGRRVKGRE